jgi:putative transposase
VKRSRFTEQQIAYALQRQALGTPVDEICRKMGIAPGDFLCLEEEILGLEPPELRCLKQLEEENSKLRKPVADPSLDQVMLQDVVRRTI